jgi:hypothetical protein
MQYFLQSPVTFRRLRRKSGIRSAYSATGTVEYASIQHPSAETAALYGGLSADLYQVFLDGEQPYLPGDQIRYNGQVYGIRDTKLVDFGCQHYTVLIVSHAN